MGTNNTGQIFWISGISSNHHTSGRPRP